VNQSVDRSLHITRVTRFAEEREAEIAAAATSPATTKPPRPQPKGLKPRYQPFGVTKGGASNVEQDSSDNDEDVEMAQAPPILTDSAASAKSDTPKKAAKKRKHGDVEKGTPNKEEPASKSAKKSKKARVDSKKAVESEPAEVAEEPEPAQSSSVKKAKGKDKSKKKDSASAPAKVTPILPPAVPGMKST
jgi:hypothetical protein